MGSIDIENVITEREKELKTMLSNLKTVEQSKLSRQREKLEHERDIDILKIAINDLTSGIKEARYLVDKQKIEINLLTKDFWAAKNSGG